MCALSGAQPAIKGKPRSAVLGSWKASSRANLELLLHFAIAEYVTWTWSWVPSLVPNSQGSQEPHTPQAGIVPSIITDAGG